MVGVHVDGWVVGVHVDGWVVGVHVYMHVCVCMCVVSVGSRC